MKMNSIAKTWMRRTVALSAVCGLLLALPGYKPKTFRMGFTPVESGAAMQQITAPVVKAMSQAIGMKVVTSIAADYVGTIEAMRAGKVDAALLSPAAMVMARKKAGAKPLLKTKYKGKTSYFAVIFTKADAPFKTIADLKGQTFAFVDPGSTSGYVVPALMLMKAGVKPDRDLKHVLNAGTHDAVLQAVLHGQAAAGASFQKQKGEWPLQDSLKNPDELKKLRVLAYSDPIPDQGVAVNATLDADLQKRVADFFIHLSDTPEGRKMIGKFYKVDAFVPAGENDWKPVEDAFAAIGRKI
ncbi:MAG: phosphate/phosphite/phosphonate ABC transporter substrate-binding protein [Candidatus Sericytochromatia bacterium]|uniref:Phosphate/phosphite/phosphonate ABC transporter substrate-binding protein n=1 Tax=Candidatus Tanganyikabacteria bacterium TaxID=2961651 RepID=A0A937X504_9BACT|nr:phosphate/phosphite/phosphonate ABC transporter substrate-binding protein [Candidatus Tanganyikabacteria bacterium]